MKLKYGGSGVPPTGPHPNPPRPKPRPDSHKEDACKCSNDCGATIAALKMLAQSLERENEFLRDELKRLREGAPENWVHLGQGGEYVRNLGDPLWERGEFVCEYKEPKEPGESDDK